MEQMTLSSGPWKYIEKSVLSERINIGGNWHIATVHGSDADGVAIAAVHEMLAALIAWKESNTSEMLDKAEVLRDIALSKVKITEPKEVIPFEWVAEEEPEFMRLQQTYGHETDEELGRRLEQMAADVRSNHKAGLRQPCGDGWRGTSAAVSAQASRDIAEEKRLIERYKKAKFG